MCRNKDKNKDKKRCDFTMIMIWTIMVIIVLAIVCCVISFFCPIFKYPNEDNLVITFLGALAAFVVISNYAIMVEIRNKAKDDIKTMEERVEKIAGLEEYYDYAIKNEIATLLQNYGINGAFGISTKTMKIEYAGNMTFFVRVRIPKRDKGEILLDEMEYRYFVVWLDKKDGKELTKEQFDDREAI